MNKTPKELNEQMNEDQFYTRCCLRQFGGCGGVNFSGRSIERHHALIYAGRQLQKLFAILPTCPDHHRIANRKDIKEKFDWVLLNRATEEELEAISKSTNYKRERDRLNNIYGVWKQ